MRALYVLLLLTCAIAHGNWKFQANWVGGGGIPGPSPYWTISFHEQEGMYWAGEFYLTLGLVPTLNFVSSADSHDVLYPADMNGDGFLDIVTHTWIDGEHLWLENDGTGTTWTEHLIAYSPSLNALGTFPVDIDGDGDQDVLCAFHGHQPFFWYENANSIGTEWNCHAVDSLRAELLWGVDIDGDGDKDIVATSDYEPWDILWWENLTGTGTEWEQHDVLLNEDWFWVNEIYPVDLDLDGDLDVLAALFENDGLVFCRNEDGLGTSWSYYQFDCDSEYGTTRSCHAGDLDGDGDMDVAAADADPPYCGRAYWFENLDGSCENWEQHMLDDSLAAANAVRFVDLTDDGCLDILVGSGSFSWGGDEEICFWENVGGDGENLVRHQLASGFPCADVRGADINGDGVTDFIFNSEWSAVGWGSLEGSSSGWLTSTILDVGGYPEWQSFDWEGVIPPGTEMYFQARGSNDWTDMGEWSDYMYEPGNLEGYIDSTYRYIQYKVLMESDGPFGTPALDMIAFEWDNMGVGEEEGGDSFAFFGADRNPSGRWPSLSFHLPAAGSAELAVYDLAGRTVFCESAEHQAGVSSVIVPALSPGTYFARLRYSGEEEYCRFLVVPFD
jgi:hypothetical protein